MALLWTGRGGDGFRMKRMAQAPSSGATPAGGGPFSSSEARRGSSSTDPGDSEEPRVRAIRLPSGGDRGGVGERRAGDLPPKRPLGVELRDRSADVHGGGDLDVEGPALIGQLPPAGGLREERGQIVGNAGGRPGRFR